MKKKELKNEIKRLKADIRYENAKLQFDREREIVNAHNNIMMKLLFEIYDSMSEEYKKKVIDRISKYDNLKY